MISRKSLWRGVALFAGTSALMATSMAGAFSAPGGIPGPPPGGGGGGGGGGGHQPGEETSNNLSVPAVFVPSVGVGSPVCDGTARPAAGDTSTFPEDFVLPLAGVATGEYYVQGEDTWQAGCTAAAAGVLTAVPAWGDNLAGGSAALKVGSPVRVEVGLTTTGYSLTGFDTVKLTDQLDRLATYGTLGVAETPYEEVRVWSSDAEFSITGPVDIALQSMGAEINSTGRVVYGYNWRPSVAGEYTIHFQAPAVGITTADITVTVSGSAGGGGGRGGGGGGGPR